MRTRNAASILGATGIAAALVATGAMVPAQADTEEQVTITVDPTVPGRTVSPDLFGANHRFGFNAFGTADPDTGEPDEAFVDAIA